MSSQTPTRHKQTRPERVRRVYSKQIYIIKGERKAKKNLITKNKWSHVHTDTPNQVIRVLFGSERDSCFLICRETHTPTVEGDISFQASHTLHVNYEDVFSARMVTDSS